MADDSIPQKRCTKCGELKPATFEYFRKDRNRLGAWCKACCAKNAKDWYITHPEQAAQSRKTYHENHRDDLIAYKKAWDDANPEYMKDYRIKNAPMIKRQLQEWRDKNPTKVKFILQRRQSRRRGLPGDYTEAQWKVALTYFNHRCAVCDRPIGLWHKLVPDHWIPIHYDGADNPGGVAHNLVPMCHGVGGCNNSKGGTMPHKWVTAKYGKHKAKEIIGRIEAYLEAVKNGSLGNSNVQAT